ncbi:MAG TPA: HPr family phosphocarrier protein [Sulfolobales archaeon]|nr:HPr family phosphocarrier protein [Sulfolobales archaeon]
MKVVEIKIINRSGLHARPAARFVQEALKFKSQITLCKGDKCVDSKNILKVLSLGVDLGDLIVMKIEGEDEDYAYKRLVDLLLKELPEEDR